MKERLTKRKGNFVFINTDAIPRSNCTGEYGFKFCRFAGSCPSITSRKCPILRVLDRLAEYEDKAETIKKQSEGKWVQLPCNVGDTVYVPWRWGGQRAVATVKVEEIKFYDSQMHYMFLIDMESDNECFNQSFGGWKTDKCIGETVFLTKEEAEKALAKMKGGAK